MSEITAEELDEMEKQVRALGRCGLADALALLSLARHALHYEDCVRSQCICGHCETLRRAAEEKS